MQQFDGVGVEIVGPRSSEPTRQIVDFVRSNRLPYTRIHLEADGLLAMVEACASRRPTSRAATA